MTLINVVSDRIGHEPLDRGSPPNVGRERAEDRVTVLQRRDTNRDTQIPCGRRDVTLLHLSLYINIYMRIYMCVFL